jgi:hypothetical protein
MSNSNIAILWTHVLGWYVIMCGYNKSGHRKEMCSKEIGISAHNMLTILGSTFNMFVEGGDYTTT